MNTFLFGSTPDFINKQLIKPFSNVAWNTLPVATEFTSQDVRYLKKPLSDFSGLPYQDDLYQSCSTDGSYIAFLFTKDGLFDVSIRFAKGCSAKNSLVTNIANRYNITINKLASGDVGFKYNGNIIFSSQTNIAASTSSLDWVSKSIPITNTLKIANPISLPIGTVGIAYPVTAVTPSGGVAPYTITVSSLPAGMSYNGTNIGGTPPLSAIGTTTISISAKDTNGATILSKLPLTINPPPAIVPSANLPATGNVGVLYKGSLTATGGVGTLAFSAIGLPSGLSMSGGAISGTPTKTGTFVITLAVKDSIGQLATAIKTIIINPAVIRTYHVGDIGPAGGKVFYS